MTIEEYYALGFNEAAKRDKFFKKVSEHINHAREKHPFFCELGTYDANEFASYARAYKEAIPAEPTLTKVLLSEVYECLEAFAKGDKAQALEEACDVVAVLYRAYAGDIEKGGAQ